MSHHRSKHLTINSKSASELHVFQQIPELFVAPRANHHPPNYLHSTILNSSVYLEKKSILKLFITLSNLGSPDKRASSITWFDKFFFCWRCQPVVCFFCWWLILWQPGWSGGDNQNNWNHQLVVAGHFQFRDIAGLGNCQKERWPTNTTHLNSYVKGIREKKRT